MAYNDGKGASGEHRTQGMEESPKGTPPKTADAAPSGNAGREEMVGSLIRGVNVIKAFGEDRAELTLSEVADRADMTRASARRFLRTLQALGYVNAEGRYFRLSPRILELGYTYLSSLPWWRSAQKVIERLAAELGRPCAAGVIDQTEVLYLAHAIPYGSETFRRSVGSRLPIFATAMGRVMLANLPEAEQDAYLERITLRQITPYTISSPRAFKAELRKIQQDRFALIDQELEVGLRQVGVPIFDRGGQVPAAIATSDHRPMSDRNQMIEEVVQPMRAAAAEISESIPT